LHITKEDALKFYTFFYNQGSICQISSGGGVRVLGFDMRTGAVPRLGTSAWRKVASRSAGVCIREGRQVELKSTPLNPFMNIS